MRCQIAPCTGYSRVIVDNSDIKKKQRSGRSQRAGPVLCIRERLERRTDLELELLVLVARMLCDWQSEVELERANRRNPL